MKHLDAIHGDRQIDTGSTMSLTGHRANSSCASSTTGEGEFEVHLETSRWKLLRRFRPHVERVACWCLIFLSVISPQLAPCSQNGSPGPWSVARAFQPHTYEFEAIRIQVQPDDRSGESGSTWTISRPSAEPRQLHLQFTPTGVAIDQSGRWALALCRMRSIDDQEMWVTAVTSVSLEDGECGGSLEWPHTQTYERAAPYATPICVVTNASTGRVLLGLSDPEEESGSSFFELLISTSGDVTATPFADINTPSDVGRARVVAMTDVPGTPVVVAQLCGSISGTCCRFYSLCLDTRCGSRFDAGTAVADLASLLPTGLRPCVHGACESEIVQSTDPGVVALLADTPGKSWALRPTVSSSGESFAVYAGETPVQAHAPSVMNRTLSMRIACEWTVTIGGWPLNGKKIGPASIMPSGHICMQFEGDGYLYVASPDDFALRRVAESVLPELVMTTPPVDRELAISAKYVYMQVGIIPDEFARIDRTSGAIAHRKARFGDMKIGADDMVIDFDRESACFASTFGGPCDRLGTRANGDWIECLVDASPIAGGGFCFLERTLDYWRRRVFVLSVMESGTKPQEFRIQLDGEPTQICANARWVLIQSVGRDAWVVERTHGTMFALKLPAIMDKGSLAPFALQESTTLSVLGFCSDSGRVVRLTPNEATPINK